MRSSPTWSLAARRPFRRGLPPRRQPAVDSISTPSEGFGASRAGFFMLRDHKKPMDTPQMRKIAALGLTNGWITPPKPSDPARPRKKWHKGRRMRRKRPPPNPV